MIPAIIGWFSGSKTGKLVAAIAAGAIALGLALLKAFSAGKTAAQVDGMKAQVKNVEVANEAKREVDDAARAGAIAPSVRKFYIDGDVLPGRGANPEQHAKR